MRSASHGPKSDFQRTSVIYTVFGAGLTGVLIAVSNCAKIHQ